MKCNAVKYSSRETQLRFRENTSYTQRRSLVGTLEIEKKKKRKRNNREKLNSLFPLPVYPEIVVGIS